MENIVVRELGVADIALLQDISRETFHDSFASYNTEENMKKYLGEKFSTQKLTDELVHPESKFYFALLDDRVIGYLKLNLGSAQTELHSDNGLEIERIYILKEFQGKKVGQVLYEKAIAVASEYRVPYVWLGVWEENKKAIGFYKKNGFSEFDRHIFKLGDDEQTDIMMKKAINT